MMSPSVDYYTCSFLLVHCWSYMCLMSRHGRLIEYLWGICVSPFTISHRWQRSLKNHKFMKIPWILIFATKAAKVVIIYGKKFLFYRRWHDNLIILPCFISREVILTIFRDRTADVVVDSCTAVAKSTGFGFLTAVNLYRHLFIYCRIMLFANEAVVIFADMVLSLTLPYVPYLNLSCLTEPLPALERLKKSFKL